MCLLLIILFVGIVLLFIYVTVLCPSTPSNIQHYSRDAQVVISWDPQENIDVYEIRYWRKSNLTTKWTWNAISGQRICTYSLFTINGISYEIEIRAKSRLGVRGFSKMIIVCSRATAHTNVSASYNENNSNAIVLRWFPVSNCNGYIIKRATSSENGVFSYIQIEFLIQVSVVSKILQLLVELNITTQLSRLITLEKVVNLSQFRFILELYHLPTWLFRMTNIRVIRSDFNGNECRIVMVISFVE